MDLITKERDRLLQRTARVYGLSFTIVALLCFVLPGAVSSAALFISLPLFVVLGVAQFRMGVSRSPVWLAIALVAGLAIVVIACTVGSASARRRDSPPSSNSPPHPSPPPASCSPRAARGSPR